MKSPVDPIKQHAGECAATMTFMQAEWLGIVVVEQTFAIHLLKFKSHSVLMEVTKELAVSASKGHLDSSSIQL